MQSDAIIRVTNLSKRFRVLKRKPGFLGGLRTLFSTDYDQVRAVHDISFEIAPGELVGYIGPNGAGKSTTIKILTGILQPSSGNVAVAGLTPYRERIRNSKQIGVIFGQRSQLLWDIPPRDSVVYPGGPAGLSFRSPGGYTVSNRRRKWHQSQRRRPGGHRHRRHDHRRARTGAGRGVVVGALSTGSGGQRDAVFFQPLSDISLSQLLVHQRQFAADHLCLDLATGPVPGDDLRAGVTVCPDLADSICHDRLLSGRLPGPGRRLPLLRLACAGGRLALFGTGALAMAYRAAPLPEHRFVADVTIIVKRQKGNKLNAKEILALRVEADRLYQEEKFEEAAIGYRDLVENNPYDGELRLRWMDCAAHPHRVIF